jgi:dTDP-4-amino-4,6-dideoxygalactose transaminase
MPTETSDRILQNDFRAQWGRVRAAVLEAVDRVGRSGWLILGSEVSCFEEELAKFWGLPRCVGCASGLDALEISLRCLGLHPGDPVLTTPFSAFATSLAVIRAGGVPVFVDVDDTGLIDLELAAKALESEPSIRFLLPVHLYGHAVDLERLAALRDRFELRIVEDCAQAIAAKSHGMAVGSVGELGATSFYPTKNLGCMGDGGAILTESADLAELAKSLRDYGQTDKYVHAHFGMNSRLDELQAALLRTALLPELPHFNRRRAAIAAHYGAEIGNRGLALPPQPEASESVWHLFPVLVRGSRSSFRDHLRQRGIETGLHYPTLIPDQGALEKRGVARQLSTLDRARRFAAQEVSLPIHPFLDNRAVERVIQACNSWQA